jgi:glucokinase
MRELFVVVSGAPGSGKSTLARQLASALGLPLFMKDTIKEALGDVLGAPDVAASKRLGAATMEALVAVARDNAGGVIESTWIPELARAQLDGVAPIVEVLCDVPLEVALDRYGKRAGTRHPVHFDAEQPFDAHGWQQRASPIAGGWPVIRVDTTQEVDVDALVQQIVRA